VVEPGIAVALAMGMATTTQRDLRVWQRAQDVRIAALRLTRRPRVRADPRFCAAVQQAAHGACRSITEGFLSRDPAVFAGAMMTASRRLAELLDLLDEALAREWLTRDDYAVLEQQVQVAMRSASAYRSVLERQARSR
jgi:four helix bundle protein